MRNWNANYVTRPDPELNRAADGKSMDPAAIEQLIRKALPEADVQVASDDGVHFRAVVTSERFSGRRKLDCHREVYAALGERVGGDIHALSLETRTPPDES